MNINENDLEKYWNSLTEKEQIEYYYQAELKYMSGIVESRTEAIKNSLVLKLQKGANND